MNFADKNNIKQHKPEYKYLVKANVDFCHFTKEDFTRAIKDYQARSRRFGGV